MLDRLGNIIEKRPWFVIIVILLITAGFASLIPSLEMKTDFADFMPENELVEANQRVFKYFGEMQQIMLIYSEKQNAESVLSPQVLKVQHAFQQQLAQHEGVMSIFSITTFIDQLCFLEFGQPLDNCTDEQINMALQDLLEDPETADIRILNEDDPNEPVDYQRGIILPRKKELDSIDIKNGYISADDQSITFTIEVYDLSALSSSLLSPLQPSNVVEWYMDFENLITPDERLDIKYRIAAHIEPANQLWEIGKGVGANLKALIEHARNRELFNTYQKQAYLWIKAPEQPMYMPLPLDDANVTFDTDDNKIHIQVPKEELAQFGIAIRFGSIELPAKLSEFKAGVRYYETPLFNRPWRRVSLNTNFLFNRLQKIQTRPLLGPIAERMMKRFANISFDDLEQFLAIMDEGIPLPDRMALKDIDSLWTVADVAPDTGTSQEILFLRPKLFEDLKINALGLLSKDYEQTQTPKANLIILGLNSTQDYEAYLQTNIDITDEIREFSDENRYISMEATGEGVISAQMNEVTTEANQILGPSMFIIIIFILFISFRKISYVIFPLIALAVSTIWLFGTMVLLGVAFSVMYVAIIPLILGLGVDYSVHLFHNYRVEIELGFGVGEAIKKSVKEVGIAMFLAMITTVIAFMSFLSATIPPLRNLGVLLGLGVLYTFITAITLLASLRFILDRNKKVITKQKQSNFSLKNIMESLSKTVLHHQKKILIFTIIFSLIFAFGAVQLETGFDLNEFLPEGNKAMELYTSIADEFPSSSQDQEYILIEGDVATVTALKGIAKTHENLEDDTYVSRNTDGSVKATSIYTLIQQAIKNNDSLITTFNIDEATGIPKTDKDVRALYDYLFGVDISELATVDASNIESFNINEITVQVPTVLSRNNSRYESALIRIYVDSSVQISEDRNMNEEMTILKTELNDDIDSYGDATAVATGTFIITLTITDSMNESQILSTGISMILAAFVIILVYRNPTLGLIAVLPVGIAMVWILGTMQFIGYSLNVMTITVTSITIGIGIDYAIHATERFRFVADKTGDITKAVSETISRTGGALLIAALTTTFGFGILVLAPMPPQQQFGIIMAITITYSFLISVIVLPLVLYHWAKWRRKRKGYIISPKKYKKS